MRTRTTAITLLGLATALSALAAQDPALKPGPKAGAAAGIPRTPDGRPDLQGTWTNETITPVSDPPRSRPRR